jgi:DNA repair exonuclease SbcCD ATPase subunit
MSTVAATPTDGLNLETEFGLTPETIAKMKEKGLLADPAKEAELQKALEEERKKGFSIAQQQLYPTVEKLKEDNEKIMQMLEATQKEKADAEAAAKAAAEAEAQKAKSIEEKLEALRADSKKAIDEVTQTYQSKLNELNSNLYVEKLASVRKDLILQNDLLDLDNLIDSPLKNPNLTVEQLQASIEVAKATKAQLLEKAKKETEELLKKQQEQQAASTPRPTPTGFPVVSPSITGGNATQPFDLSKIANASKAELDKVRDEILARYGV